MDIVGFSTNPHAKIRVTDQYRKPAGNQFGVAFFNKLSKSKSFT